MQHILRKIGVSDRTQAAVWAVRKATGLSPVSEDHRHSPAGGDRPDRAVRLPLADQVRRPRGDRRGPAARHRGRGDPRRPPRPRVRLDAHGQRLGLAEPARCPADAALAAMIALGQRLARRGRRLPRRRPSAGDHARAGRGLPGRGRRGDRRGRAWPSRCRDWPSSWRPARWRRRSTTPTARPWARTPTTCLGPEFVNRDLAAYLGAEFAGEYLDRYTLRQPKPRMPLYHLVGALDPLTDADVRQPIDDGLPETLPEWIAGRRADAPEDQAQRRRPGVGRGSGGRRSSGWRPRPKRRRGCTAWCYSADFNEKCRNVEYVLDFLARVGRALARGPASGSSTSSSPRTATCAPIPKTACTRPPRSSPW